MLDQTSHGLLARKIAVIGSGISGLSAAWLLSQHHQVTLFEEAGRAGGHANTVEIAGELSSIAVDTGFIVYNEVTYPNLTALFSHLGVESQPTEMSFAVSLDNGRLEYAGTGLSGLFVQRLNIFNPRFHEMIRDLLRFYRNAPRELAALEHDSLESYLSRNGYGQAFRDDHLYPMAAAIWSTPAGEIGAYPARSFVRFCENHGLLKLTGRPLWRTVKGGSRNYVERMLEAIGGGAALGRGVRGVRRRAHGVEVIDCFGRVEVFDDVVLACHADQALALIDAPTARETDLLGRFRYSINEAVLHSDPKLMPRRRKAWCAWNYLADRSKPTDLCVTYWMNRLQRLETDRPVFVTLNPHVDPDPGLVHRRQSYEHPLFDRHAIRAQHELWSLQGQGGLWFAGAYFGAGFHEDGLQAGLAVAEALGGVRRPWRVAHESGRICLPGQAAPLPVAA